MATEQRVDVEHIDSALTRRDVVRLFRALAALPDDASPDAVADEAERVLANPNETEEASDAGRS